MRTSHRRWIEREPTSGCHRPQPPAEPPAAAMLPAAAEQAAAAEKAATAEKAAKDTLVNFPKYAPNALTAFIDRALPVNKIRRSQSIPWFGLVAKNEELWVRKSYLELWQVVQEQLSRSSSTGLVVTGNPGIGKTVGGINTIATLSIEDDPKRLVVILSGDVCLIFMGDSWYQMPGLLPEEGAEATCTALLAIAQCYPPEVPLPQLLLLHDVNDNKRESGFGYQAWFVSKLRGIMEKRNDTFGLHCVLFTSPEVCIFSQVRRDFADYAMFYMPTWSLEELNAVKDSLKWVEDVGQRFREIGGIVRWFQCGPNGLCKVADVRTGALRAGAIQATFSNRHDFSLAESSALFQIVPSADKRGYSVTFLSDEARRMWINARRGLYGDDARALLLSSIAAKCTAEVIGRQVEGVFRHRLQRDSQRKFTVTYLGEGTTTPRTLSTLLPSIAPGTPAAPQTVLRSAGPFAERMNMAVLELPAVTATIELTGQISGAISDTPGLYVPRDSNCPFVDFVIVTANKEAWMFQVTVASRHSPQKAHYDKFVKHFGTFTPPLQPFLVWVGRDGDGVSSLQCCNDNSPIPIPQFSLRLGVVQTEVWLRQQVASGTAVPQPFSILLDVDGRAAVEAGLKQLDPALVLDSRKGDEWSSSPARPWRFNWNQ